MIRLLPLMIFLGLFMLGFRVTVVVKDMQSLVARVELGTQPALAQAQEEPAAEPAVAADEVADTMDAESSMADMGDGGESVEPIDPAQFTRSEVELLQRLAERREVIDGREKELDQREAMIQAAETRIDRKITELQQLERNLQALVAEADAQQKAKVEQLVRIYGAMKPKDAARIFNDLEMPILITVIESMRENKVAPILAEMDAARATAVTEELSVRKSLPGMPDDPQG